MAVVTLTLNDQLISAREGQSLLEVIRDHGVDLPTLCHLDGLSERGGCRLCMVEMEGTSRLQAACVTPVQGGMSIRTHSERLVRYRKMLVELLLAERSHVCSVCIMNGRCELQSLAARLGIDHVRYEPLHPDLPVDASHGRFVLDHNRCILCGRCVRACDEVEGAHTLDVMGRGVRSRIIVDLDQPWGSSRSCTGCGKCVQVCPTGAMAMREGVGGILEKRPDFLIRILEGRQKRIWRW